MQKAKQLKIMAYSERGELGAGRGERRLSLWKEKRLGGIQGCQPKFNSLKKRKLGRRQGQPQKDVKNEG
jgi:hypothetical protein